jgi:hypothetical protein
MRLFVDTDTAAVLRRVQAVEGSVEKARPALLAAADEIREQLDLRFTRGIRPQVSVDWRRRKGPGRPTLVFTGELRRSLTQAGHRYARERVGGDSLLVGTSDPVAPLLKRGARGTRKRNPASLTAPARKQVVQAFRDELLRSLQ